MFNVRHVTKPCSAVSSSAAAMASPASSTIYTQIVETLNIYTSPNTIDDRTTRLTMFGGVFFGGGDVEPRCDTKTVARTVTATITIIICSC